MGVPFYGRGWSGVSGGDGLFRPAAGPASPGTWEAGVFDYHDLVANYLPMPSYQRHRHPEAKVPWLFSSEAGVMISYDDPESMATKAEYVLANGMGGVMFWELSGDTSDSALLGALHTTLAQ